ncbi:T9SS type A sorting domain-containing protein [Pontibacter sp. G13]|uniref:T9SS type A sorting domain-containing protein n=1 Tax=Pontibacter sp. G13 TaxID=3074898 RepID=UPI00288B090C|nr:T9SS type A sorting domain-containing protein [Pontibacter sp. G13]WNJ16743.1 T9SS type A sorting domain-containing protein [Pontibacter sp. G13]
MTTSLLFWRRRSDLSASISTGSFRAFSPTYAFLAWILYAVIGMGTSPLFAQSPCVNSASPAGFNHTFTFVKVEYDTPQPGQSTWYYQVDNQGSPDISHVTFGLDLCACYRLARKKSKSTGTWDLTTGQLYKGQGLPEMGDPHVGLSNVLKFDQGFNGNGSRGYFFVLDENVPVAPIKVYFKAAQHTGFVEICGPAGDCGCELEAAAIRTECDDNGTPYDASDDQFSYFLNVHGFHTGDHGYDISGDDVHQELDYGVEVGPFGPFPISGGSLNLTLTDHDSASCVSTVVVNPPASCAIDPPCELDDPNLAVECDDAGTPMDPSDDTFSFWIEGTGSHTAANYSLSGDYAQSQMPYQTLVGPIGPFAISDGDLSLVMTDSDDGGCTVSFVVEAPSTCSDSIPPSTNCVMGTPQLMTYCSNNGTPTDPSDDVFYYYMKLSATDGANTFTLSGDDTGSQLAYGSSLGPLGPFPIAGGDLILTATDDLDPDCSITFTVEAPAPCSQSCVLDAPQIRTECDDHGTPSDSTDDVFYYYIKLTGVQTAPSFSIYSGDSQDNLAYGIEHGPFGPFAISQGDVELFMADDSTDDCNALGYAVAPSACSTTPANRAVNTLPLEDKVTMYPNPTTSSITLESEEVPTEATTVMVRDMMGYVKLSEPINLESPTTLNLDGLPTGIYTIEFWGVSQNLLWIEKLVKE